MPILNYTTTIAVSNTVGEISAMLAKAKAAAILTEFEGDRRIPPRIRTKEQAARVAWRIVKDWLEAQLAMIEAGLVDLEQVFLPYAQNQSGQTVYDVMRSQRFSNLLLEEPKAEGYDSWP